MLGKFSIALLLIASPALAAEPDPAPPNGAAEADAAPVAYKTKKICRAIEVVGSSIPRMACTTKRIPVKPANDEADANSSETPPAEAPKSE
jgi:hypothetical protein